MYESDDNSFSNSSNYEEDFQEDTSSCEKSLISKTVLHLDVDCFYCQVEEIANPELATKPFAVGQKHIIVTCNYVARSFGVNKLMGREEAKKACPELIIIEGSDLEPYRLASQSIYRTFRDSIKALSDKNACRKGGMDECYADITPSMDEMLRTNNAIASSSKQGIWIYGEDNESSKIEIREDQSGASSYIMGYQTQNAFWGTDEELKRCRKKLLLGGIVAKDIQEKIRCKTNFSVTIGVSISPMLAKLASDLKKPKSCNILYPERTGNMIENMPLRRIPGLGSRLFKLIIPVLEKYNGVRRENQIWRCKDFLNTPGYALKSCVDNTGDDRLFDLLSNRCRGIDTMRIEDDDGGLTKTVSVEETFIRGSLLSLEEVKRNLDILYTRILRLLDLRRDASPMRMYAYPTSLRLSVRIVDKSMCAGTRPFRIISKQVDFDGKELMCTKEYSDRLEILNRSISKVFHILSDLRIELDVTKLNIAALNFADIKMKINGKKNKSISTFFQGASSGTNKSLDLSVEERKTKEQHDGSVKKTEGYFLKRNLAGEKPSKRKQMKLQPLLFSKAPTAALPKDTPKASRIKPGNQKKVAGIEHFFFKK
jgi:DNA polymerase iota